MNKRVKSDISCYNFFPKNRSREQFFCPKNRSREQFFCPKNRRGQFYLIAAIVIISVIVGFASISNYSKKEDYEKINNLRDELQIETRQIIEYAVNTHEIIGRLSEIDKCLEEVSNIYANNTEIENMYFIGGDKTRVIISGYLKKIPENLSINENSTLFQPALNSYDSVYYTPPGGKVTINIDNTEHYFELKSGINLYFIISKGDYIATNANM